MKKKNVLTLALSLCLVAVIAIGGTFAYLTAAPDEATNTFAFATGFDDGDGVINVKVEEDASDFTEEELGNAVAANNGETGGIDYTNVVPNQTLPKEPVISTKAKVDSWVFVRVTNGDYVSVDEASIADGWTKITVDPAVPGQVVYAYETPVAAQDNYTQVGDGAFFTQVKVANLTNEQLEEITEADNVKIEVAAVQTGITNADGAAVDTPQGVYDTVGVDTLFQAVGG